MITGPVYYRWRETGIAFESRDSAAYSFPNRTLLSSLSVSQKDSKYDMEGYWGDMLTSPFVAFGLGEDALKYRKVRNDIDTVSSEIASQNVLMDYLQMIFALEKPDNSSEKKEATLTEITESVEADSTDGDALLDWKSRYRIVFLPPVNNSVISDKEKYRGLFDVAYVGGHSLLDSLTGLMRMLRPGARVIFETPKYLIGLPKTRCADYHETLKERFAKNGFDVSTKYNREIDDYFVFTFPGSDSIRV
ncbi:hypothetical protein RvY_13282 [Ramazzottius varieornatus]|uniref:Dynein assembly factor 3 C-terminal domain-containing protein n=1 Tax=Ramazzottius varieornatus TaxID=947166 RepID=A0A1D1VPJ6_RAMVA|nr:hypothetical protein RvY_13282 [Ramazzottius varieornatus]